MRKFTLTLSVLFLLSAAQAQVANTSNLSIEQIMQGDKFVGYLPSRINWSEDSKTIYFSWNPDMEKLRSTYKVSVEGGTPTKVSDEELMKMPSNGDYNKARTKKVYAKNGDLYLLNLASGTNKQLTNTIDSERSPAFSGDEKNIIYNYNNNLFAWNLESGLISQLTNFQNGNKKPDSKKPENQDWLERDQLEYFEILSERKEVRDLQKERSDRMKVKRPKTIYYGKNFLSNITITPDMKFVTYRLTKRSSAKGTKVPNYVTESGYIEDLRSRAKVGSAQSTSQFWLYDIAKDTAYKVETKQIDGIYDKPAYLKEYHKGDEEYNPKYEKPRQVVIHGPFYATDGKALVDVKALDNKDRWIMLLDLASGELTQLDRQHDDAWIGGPGISSWNFSPGNIGWLDNETIYYQSEKTGYSHLYCQGINDKKAKQLTKGNFEIIEADLSNDKKYFYITSNKENPHEHHFYKMSANGGKLEKITKEVGNHEVTISPDEKYLAIRYSYSNKPWELYIMKNEAGAAVKQLTNSTTDAFNSYKWRDPEVVYFEAEDGAKVPARLYRPEGAKKGDPAVVFVHGAGYLQNVHKWWSSYYREFMFHNILVDNGYTVLDIDYRASNGYGRDWRTGIYRFMGGKDLDDQVDGAKYLVEEHGIDKDKIGIYGGSYGGFITLMAMFNKPGTFKSGAALRSVTDWAHYNHGYTANILNTPVEDSIAYYKSSPIYHAEGFEGNLVILHGMIDTNVQFQDVVRLAQRMIELGKDNWEFAVFPMERHGFVEPSSWTDEYKRIFKLFQETLKE